jgi:putative ABC transport system permease protein
MDIVAPFETIAKIEARSLTRWGSSAYYTCVLLKDGAEARALERKLPAFFNKHKGNRVQGQIPRFILQPLTQIHLHSRANFEISPNGDASFVLLFGSIAVLVLVIACVNYMNLTTARSLKRVKEVGLRKVVGAGKSQLIRQFLGDSMMMTFLALLLAVAGVLLVLPWLRSFVDREIAFNPLRDYVLTPGLVLLAAVVAAVAGSYPAFFASGFRPVSALKDVGAPKSRGRGLRNALIIFQFAASIALIICTIGVRSQLRFIQNRNMGYQRDHILVLTPRGGIRKDLEAFKTELKRNPSVLSVASSSSLPNNVTSSRMASWPGKSHSDNIEIYAQQVDYDYVELFGLEIV